MTSRKRVRLTTKKTHGNAATRKKLRREQEEYGTPTDKEFQSWPEYTRFVVTDQDEESHAVSKGDYVIVLPPDIAPNATLELCKFWVAKVRTIRCADDDRKNVWVRVQWFYSPVDLREMVKGYASSLPPASSSVLYDPFERIFSDHYDIIHHATIDGVVSVMRYEEHDLSPESIPSETFWIRYDYERGTRSVKPKPLPFTCTKESNVEESSNAGRKRKRDKASCGAYHPIEEMHLCPNPQCMTWWHTRCLSPAPPLPPPLPRRAGKGKSSLQIDPVSVQRIITSSSYLKLASFNMSLLTNLSEKIVQVAGQPMIRGGASGVVGNVREVAEARAQVLAKLEDLNGDSEITLSGKRRKLDLTACSSPRKSKLGEIVWANVELLKNVASYTCPRCGGAI